MPARLSAARLFPSLFPGGLPRLFERRVDPRESIRPLWHRTVEIAREPQWYARCHVADTVPGRFDMITAVLTMLLLRMEQEPALIPPSVLLTELFVDDMDGQLREFGINDVSVGKHMGRLMSSLGGRIGAYRDGIAQGLPPFAAALARNVTLVDGADATALAERMLALRATLADTPGDDLLAARIAR